MASTMSGNTANSNNYNIISNNEKIITQKNVRMDILSQAKKEIFETLKLDETLVNRSTTANRIFLHRDKEPLIVPTGKMDLRLDDPKLEVDFDKSLNKHSDLKKRYEIAVARGDKEALKFLDTEFAERLILDVGGSIEFKPKDNENFLRGRNANEESEITFNSLNSLIEYEGKIERVMRTLNSGDNKGDNYYIIKWKDERISKIITRYNELLKTKNDNTKKENENNDTKNNTEQNKDFQDLKKKYEELRQQNEEQDEKIKELMKRLNDKNKEDESGDPEGSTESGDPEGSTESGNPEGSTESGDPEGSTESGDPEGSTESGDNSDYEQKERIATISNVTQVNRAIIQREVDEELRQRYSDTSWFNFIGKTNLLFRRKFIKDRMVYKRMGGRRGMDWSEASQSAADRHQIEEQNNLADRMQVVINDIDSANYPETRRRLDDLLGRLTGRADTVPPRQREISDTNFQTEFQSILNMSGRIFDRTRPSTATSTNWRPISEIIRSNNIGQLSTNILMQANKFREQQFLTRSIADHIAMNPLEDDRTFNNYCRRKIKQYIDSYNDIPDFLAQTGVKLDNTDASKEIKRLQAHNGALTMIAAQSLKIRIQMLNDGGEAYNVRKEGGLLTNIGRFFDNPTGGENTRISKRMNKHQNIKEAFGWIRGGAQLGLMVAPAFLFAPMGPLAVAAGAGGMSFLTTLIKKKAHYERENRSYQRMQATNLTDYRNKRTALANEVAGMHWYEGRFRGEKAKIRKQYKDYVLTTQDQLSLSSDLLNRIQHRLQNSNILNNSEQLNLAADLADGLARLDYHRRTGQNFLGSNNPGNAEKEYRALQNAVMGGAKRLGIQVNDLRTRAPYDTYYNNTITLIEGGTGDDFDNQGYLQARKRFRTRSNTKAWYGAFKAGAISFGLSYLASNLASGNKTTTHETTSNISHGREGGEYNLGDMQEHLFVKGDLNPTMNSVINNTTSEITGGTLYSSVDSARCSAAKGAAELAAAKADLAGALSNPVVAGNPDLISAINNYVTDATTKIGMVPGLSVGNHDLAIARAIESAKEGILEPIIASGNSTIAIDPTCLHWANGGIQSSTGAVGQTFRNMGIMNIDFVKKGTEEIIEHVTRAIPIPIGLNTFGTPKSEVRQRNAA